MTKAVGLLKGFSAKYDVSIILVHHTKKSEVSDFIHGAVGSIGIVGGVDTIMSLARKRGGKEATLSITGRDVEEAEYALAFDTDTCTWSMMGAADMIAESAAKKKIFELLTAEGPMTPAEINVATGKKKDSSTVRVHLQKMLTDGIIKQQQFSGRYYVEVEKNDD
jgi:predicted HTH transcriptional regulator